MLPRPNWPLSTPTKSTFLILHYRLAQIIGRILTTCFGLSPRKHSDVMGCEHRMVDWMKNLPPVFNLDDPDLSWDEHYTWLRLQRQTLISKFHQARIALHRPYLLHGGYTDSRIACVVSAGAELRNRLRLLEEDAEALDRFKWMTVSVAASRRMSADAQVASGFAPACILGLLLARNKREDRVYDYDEIRTLFIAYIAAERRAVPRSDHSSDCEMQVLDMMLSKADAMAKRREHGELGERGEPFDAKPSEREREMQWARNPSPQHPQPLIIPPEHMHLTMPVRLSVHELTLPPSVHPHPPQHHQPLHQQHQMVAQPQQLQQHTLANGTLTLAPPAEEWLPAGRPWEPRPPYDPSAAAFPAADDMQSWNTLLNFIGTPAEAQPWYESDAVVIEE